MEQEVLHTAAHVAFTGSPAKEALAHLLIRRQRGGGSGNGGACASLTEAASAAGVAPNRLVELMRSEPCFALRMGPDGQQQVALQPGVLVAQARRATSTGVLFGELPPPAGYVDGVYPIRPGRPDCSHYSKFGVCKFKEGCVFNHLEGHAATSATARSNSEPRAQPTQSAAASRGSDSSTSSSSRSAPQPAQGRQQEQHQHQHQHQQRQQSRDVLFGELPPPAGYVDGMYPIRPGRPNCGHYSKFGVCAFKEACVFNHPEGGSATAPARSSSEPRSQPTQSAAASRGSGSGGNSSRASSSTPQPAQGRQQQQQHQHQHQHQQQGQGQGHRLPPGFGANASSGGPSSSSSAHERSTRAPPGGSSSSSTQPGGGWAGHAAGNKAADRVPASPDAAAVITRRPQDASPGAGAPSSSSGGGGRGAASSSSGSGGAPRQPGKQGPKLPGERFSQLGRNDEGLPQRAGAPSCPFYQGTGYCGFKGGCKYHHPSAVLHPVCVLKGDMPRKYDVNVPPPYCRLVNHVQRLYDYASCAEAQLKVWLARHLLARENPECSMFDASAALRAAHEAPSPRDARPLGPYSCSLQEAGQVLELLWQAQPDEAAQGAMPYSGRVDALLASDPYFDLRPDRQTGQRWVRLRVGRIKELLNF